MVITIDAAGRVVIPQAVRSRLGLQAGTRIELEETDGAVLLRPVSRVRIETGADGLPVVRASAGAPPLDADEVRRVIEETREWPRR